MRKVSHFLGAVSAAVALTMMSIQEIGVMRLEWWVLAVSLGGLLPHYAVNFVTQATLRRER